MEMILNSTTVTAQELERYGLLSKVLPADEVLVAAMTTASNIAGTSIPAK